MHDMIGKVGLGAGEAMGNSCCSWGWRALWSLKGCNWDFCYRKLRNLVQKVNPRTRGAWGKCGLEMGGKVCEGNGQGCLSHLDKPSLCLEVGHGALLLLGKALGTRAEPVSLCLA